MENHKESDDFEQKMNEARLEEARAKAEKAREEARHEKTKRAKTEREAEHVSHSKWHDGAKAVAAVGTFCLAVAALVLKAKSEK